MPKAIIFDLDSTLAYSKQPLGADMAGVLKELLNRVPVAVMSGADRPQFEEQFLKHMPEGSNFSNLFLFPTSANECLTYKDGKWVQEYDFVFTEEEKNKIFDAFEKVLRETGILEGEPSFGERIEDRGEQVTLSCLGQKAPLELKEKWDPDHKKREVIREHLIKLIPEFDVRIGGLTSVDVVHKGASKADGVNWLAKRFNISPQDMLYVGDALFEGGNDNVVVSTGIQTKSVSGPGHTLSFIETLI